MGLVTRRSDQLDKLFENFAIDPKKARKANPKPKDTNSKSNQTKEEDQNQHSSPLFLIFNCKTVWISFI